jgi:large subunit ribosomal protein L11
MTLIKLLVEGGNMTPGPAVAQQLGPTGVDIGQVISNVNVATSKFTGVTLPVHLTIDPSTKKIDIKVLSPPTSELIKKELGLKKASGARLKQRVGNFAIEQVIAIAKQKHDAMLSNDFMATVKTVLGTCQALGVMVESKEVKEVIKNIGQYSKEIDAKKTDVEPIKREELDDYFTTVAAKQESLRKAEDAEKSVAEAKKAKKSVKK